MLYKKILYYSNNIFLANYILNSYTIINIISFTHTMSDALDRFLSIGGDRGLPPNIATSRTSATIRSDNMAIDSEQEAEECGERLSESTEPVEQKCARFLPTPSITLIYGPPGRGKSYLLRKMYENPPLNEYGQCAVDSVVVFTDTPKDWADIEKICVREWSEEILAKLMRYQKNKKIPAHTVIILDDLLAKINYDMPLMTELFTRHRHYNLSVLIAVQNITKTIHPLVRGQVSRFICFEPPSLESCKKIHEAFCSSLWSSSREMYKKIKELNMLESHSY